jgi:hypothetical protein
MGMVIRWHGHPMAWSSLTSARDGRGGTALAQRRQQLAGIERVFYRRRLSEVELRPCAGGTPAGAHRGQSFKAKKKGRGARTSSEEAKLSSGVCLSGG